MKLQATVTLLASSLLISTSAQGVQVDFFYDDFGLNSSGNNSGVVGNGWTEIEKDANDVAIVTGYLRIRDSAGADFGGAVTHVVAQDWENIGLEFRWQPLSNSDPDDYLRVSWATQDSNVAADWTPIYFNDTTNGYLLPLVNSAWIEPTITSAVLDTAINSSSDLYLRFWIDVQGSDDQVLDEGVVIDYVKLSGTPISQAAPVPVPVAGWLFIGALASLFPGIKRKSWSYKF